MELRPLYVLAFAVATTLGLLVLLQLGERVISRHTIASDLKADNAARRFVRVGQVLAVFLISASAVKSSMEGGKPRARCAVGHSLRRDRGASPFDHGASRHQAPSAR